MERRNVHATALVVGSTGLLILGESGAGKSLLAATLLENARGWGRYAALVADDRVWLSRAHGRLVAEAPRVIAGLLELRGYGPAPVRCEPTAVIDRAIRLVEAEAAPRLSEGSRERIADVALPCLRLAVRSTVASAAAVTAWLDAPADETE